MSDIGAMWTLGPARRGVRRVDTNIDIPADRRGQAQLNPAYILTSLAGVHMTNTTHHQVRIVCYISYSEFLFCADITTDK